MHFVDCQPLGHEFEHFATVAEPAPRVFSEIKPQNKLSLLLLFCDKTTEVRQGAVLGIRDGYKWIDDISGSYKTFDTNYNNL